MSLIMPMMLKHASLKLILEPSVFRTPHGVLHIILKDIQSKIYINDIFKNISLDSWGPHKLYYQSVNNSGMLYLEKNPYHYINKISYYDENGIIHKASLPERSEFDFDHQFRRYVSLEFIEQST